LVAYFPRAASRRFKFSSGITSNERQIGPIITTTGMYSLLVTSRESHNQFHCTLICPLD